MFLQLAPPSLEPDEIFMLNDLPFYEVAHLEDFEACQAHLEEWKKKHHEGTLRQASVVSRLISNSVVRPPT